MLQKILKSFFASHSFFFFLIKKFFFLLLRSLVPQPGIKPASLAVKVWSPNYWTFREFPHSIFIVLSPTYQLLISCTCGIILWIMVTIENILFLGLRWLTRENTLYRITGQKKKKQIWGSMVSSLKIFKENVFSLWL